MRLGRTLLAALCIGAPSQAYVLQSPPKPSWPNVEEKVGHWSVFSSEELPICILAMERDNELVALTYNARLKNAQISFTSIEATSLKDGENRSLSIDFVIGEKTLDDGWGSKQFTVHVLPSGKRRFDSEGLDTEILKDFARGSGLGFFTGDHMVEAFDLEGTSAAVERLRACSMHVAGLNPEDPFLK